MKKIALITLALAATATDVQAQWSTLTFLDEWGEPDGIGAQSRPTKAVRKMSFPYGDVTARLMVNGCNSAWIRFSENPNLTDMGTFGDGYTRYNVSVRIDGQRETWSMHQNWGDQDLIISSFANVRSVLRKWSSATVFEVSLPWYGERSAVFKFDMSGSSEAIGTTCNLSDNSAHNTGLGLAAAGIGLVLFFMLAQ